MARRLTVAQAGSRLGLKEVEQDLALSAQALLRDAPVTPHSVSGIFDNYPGHWKVIGQCIVEPACFIDVNAIVVVTGDSLCGFITAGFVPFQSVGFEPVGPLPRPSFRPPFPWQ